MSRTRCGKASSRATKLSQPSRCVASWPVAGAATHPNCGTSGVAKRSEQAASERRPRGQVAPPGMLDGREVLLSSLMSSVVLLLAAWLGYGFAVRQDERRWTREQRAALYVDLLVEANAEREWLEQLVARRELHSVRAEWDPDDGRAWKAIDAEDDSRWDAQDTDTRMTPPERARLGARTAAWASDEVLRRWGRFQAYGGRALLPVTAPTASLFRVEFGAMFDALQAQIRHEFDADRRGWWQRRATTAHDAYDDWAGRARG